MKRVKRTERDFQLALIKLLNRVRASNDWSALSFEKCAKSIINCTQAEARRFQRTMVEFNYIIIGGDHRKSSPNFDVKVWKNEDLMLHMIVDILKCNPDVMKTRGRKAGISPYKKEKPDEEITGHEAFILEESEQEDIESDPYAGITLTDAINLLREMAHRCDLQVEFIFKERD